MRTYGQFTAEQSEWLAINVGDKPYHQITSEFNSTFGTDLKTATMRHRIIRDGLRENGVTGGQNEFTNEQDEWLKSNVKNSHMKWSQVAKAFNDCFGTDYKQEKLRGHCRRYLHFTTGITNAEYNGREEYSERYNSKDECIEVKVGGRWIAKHRYLTGAKDRNTRVVHIDGNRLNNDIDNLYVTRNSVVISANKNYQMKGKDKDYRHCALLNSELKMLLENK